MVVFIHTDHILTSEKGQMKLVSCTGNKKPFKKKQKKTKQNYNWSFLVHHQRPLLCFTSIVLGVLVICSSLSAAICWWVRQTDLMKNCVTEKRNQRALHDRAPLVTLECASLLWMPTTDMSSVTPAALGMYQHIPTSQKRLTKHSKRRPSSHSGGPDPCVKTPLHSNKM